MKKQIAVLLVASTIGGMLLTGCSSAKSVTRAEAITLLDNMNTKVTASDYKLPTKFTMSSTQTGATTENTKTIYSDGDFYLYSETTGKDSSKKDLYSKVWAYMDNNVFYTASDSNYDTSASSPAAGEETKQYSKVTTAASLVWAVEQKIGNGIISSLAKNGASSFKTALNQLSTPLPDGASESYTSSGEGNLTIDYYTTNSSSVKTGETKVTFNDSLIVDNYALSQDEGSSSMTEIKSKISWNSASISKPDLSKGWTEVSF